ncbi:MAG TPA: nucleotide exchange factor GrpE [Actinomycetota bacterium]|nr:nucleotide exchange factor GrpE [Actinomycetota bacterium]
MTGKEPHEDREERDRPKVRVVDKRRFRESGPVPEGEKTPSGTPAGSGEPTPELPPETPADLEQELAQARQEVEEYRDHLQRLQAEFDNFRKRTLKEQTRAVELAAQPAMLRLLEVLDDFDLALVAADQTSDFEKFRKGVELVYAKLVDALKAEGLERIQAEGKPFDPVEHEALMQTGQGDGEPRVAEVFRQGYRLKGTVIRPASVRVERS